MIECMACMYMHAHVVCMHVRESSYVWCVCLSACVGAGWCACVCIAAEMYSHKIHRCTFQSCIIYPFN